MLATTCGLLQMRVVSVCTTCQLNGCIFLLTSDAKDAGSGGPTLSRAIPVRSYTAGECFGASGLMQGDEFRRNTATAMTDVTLKVIPHKHFRVLLKDNHFLKAGLHATNVLRAKEEQAGSKRRAEGYNDEEDDEVVMRAKRR